MHSGWRACCDALKPAPGRGSYTLRLTITCALVITLFMTFRVPFLAVALIVVFYVSQPNVIMIKLVGIVFFVTVTLAIGLILLIFKWTYDYPLIRLIASTLLFSAAIYLMRVLGKLGLAFFVVALAVIYAQTFPAMTSQSEILVRLLLWLWAAINIAIVVTLLVNACFEQAFPAYQLASHLKTLFRQSAEQLERLQAGEPLAGASLVDMAEYVPQLEQLLKLSRLSSPQVRDDPRRWQSMIVAALRCAYLVSLLRPGPGGETQALSRALNTLAATLEPEALPAPGRAPASSNDVVIQEITGVLNSLARGEALVLPAGEKEPLLLPDAWTNPAYAHFTLKTLLATLLCYVFYTATDWQGIHTIMLSCVIVAQPGLGATFRKALLRIGGALLATVLALVCIVFIQPHVDTISGLLVMVLPVMALSAWVAAGSERVAYAGIQIAFTFSLAFLDWFGPLTNLSELSDRVIGILLGVLVSSIIHLYLWPDSEAAQLRHRLATLYRQIAAYLPDKDSTRIMPLIHAFNQTEALISRVAAEPMATDAHPYPGARHWPVARTFQLAQNIIIAGDGYRLMAGAQDPTLGRCAAQLSAYAQHIEQSGMAPEMGAAPGTMMGDPDNPWSAILTDYLVALPHWPAMGQQQQVEQQ